MEYTVESKSLLAKLLASENITVEHRAGLHTAKFLLKERTLLCPVWKDMEGDLYDLLLGHEISHALNTPPQGWHDAIVYENGIPRKRQQAFKKFLNITEDARIERLIKRTYPGLRIPMMQGYRDLLRRDFFGLSKVPDVNKLFLIDKLNLLAKLGSSINIPLTKIEQPFYERLMELETFDQALALAKELFAYSAKEQKEQKEKDKQDKKDKKKDTSKEKKQDDQQKEKKDEKQTADEGDAGDDQEQDAPGDNESDESSSDEQEDASDEGEDTQGSSSDSEQDDEAEDKEEKDSSGDGEKGEEDDAEDASKSESSQKDTGGNAQSEDYTPRSFTEEEYRKKEATLVDEQNKNTLTICDIPTPFLDYIVTPAQVVNKGLNSAFSTSRDSGHKLLLEFKRKNEPYIQLLVKEFEMKKAARSYSKSKVSSTGDIDVNKLASYRIDDNIFRKLMITHKGKSHGLVLLLDRSDSMRSTVIESTEQILVLAMFCRKVNIPFVAYTFTSNSGASRRHDFDFDACQKPQFSMNDGELVTKEIAFREILNSRMGTMDFTVSLMNQLQLSKALIKPSWGLSAPIQERLGTTPLSLSLIAVRDLLRIFKKTNNLDIVNLIIVHDGDSDGIGTVHNSKRVGKLDYIGYKVILRDKKEHITIPVNQAHGTAGLQNALLKWIQQTTGVGVFGFYIATGSGLHEAVSKMYREKTSSGTVQVNHAQFQKLKERFDEERFLESYTDGFSRFFIIPGGSKLATDEGALENTGKAWTPTRLFAAIKKSGTNQKVSRVLVRRFIELIAM